MQQVHGLDGDIDEALVNSLYANLPVPDDVYLESGESRERLANLIDQNGVYNSENDSGEFRSLNNQETEIQQEIQQYFEDRAQANQNDGSWSSEDEYNSPAPLPAQPTRSTREYSRQSRLSDQLGPVSTNF